MSNPGTRARARAVLAALALAVGVAACGDDGEDTSSSTSGSSTTSQTASGSGFDADAVLKRNYEGVVEEAPAEGPKAVPNKTIWFSNCVGFEGCARFGKGFKEAAKVLGWTVKEVDNAGDPQKSISIIRQAVAAKADGIVDTLSDCPNIKTGLKAAKDAGIPAITYAGLDCDNPALDDGGEPLYAGYIRLGKAKDSLDYYTNQGAADAEHIMALADKQGLKSPKIISALPEAQLFQDARQKGFDDKLAEICPDCEVDRPKFTSPQAAQNGQQIFKSAILKNPDAKVFYYPNDAFLPLGVQSALQANANQFAIVCCGDGGEGSTTNARENKLADTVAVNFAPLEMWGWDAADVMNRLLAGEKAADIPNQANVTFYFDKENNLPASGPIEVPYDYVGAFTKVWKGEEQ